MVRAGAFAILAVVSAARVDLAAAFPRRLIDEPVFGLYFAPDKARFKTTALADVPEPCRPFLAKHFLPQTRFLIYGEHNTSSSRLLVLGAKGAGVFLVIESNRCETGGVLPIFQQRRATAQPTSVEMPILSMQDRMAVFGNVLDQYGKAFGGKVPFFAWLDALTPSIRAGCTGLADTDCSPTYHSLPPELQDMLNRLRPR